MLLLKLLVDDEDVLDVLDACRDGWYVVGGLSCGGVSKRVAGE